MKQTALKLMIMGAAVLSEGCDFSKDSMRRKVEPPLITMIDNLKDIQKTSQPESVKDSLEIMSFQHSKRILEENYPDYLFKYAVEQDARHNKIIVLEKHTKALSSFKAVSLDYTP